jgi:hypothetical protein
MEIFKFIIDLVSLIANFLTVVASSIAIYIFIVKKREISSAFSMLLNFSFQTTLADLRGKLDRLNEYNANEPTELPEIRNILHEIAGQVRGNRRLLLSSPQLATRLETLAGKTKLSEPAKRSMIAEVREVLRNIEVNLIDLSNGGNNE